MNSNLQVVVTRDGSSTLFIPELNEHYHSHRGAQGESEHVYIKVGLRPLMAQQSHIKILEIGMGTGLNFVLTLQEALNNPQVSLEYHTLEPFPLPWEVAKQLKFPVLEGNDVLQTAFREIHGDWEHKRFSPNFEAWKYADKLENFCAEKDFDLVYFSAFAPTKQPELWSPASFAHLKKLMKPNSYFVTYASQGQARRNMQSAGFEVVKVRGALGKSEMVKAFCR